MFTGGREDAEDHVKIPQRRGYMIAKSRVKLNDGNFLLLRSFGCYSLTRGASIMGDE